MRGLGLATIATLTIPSLGAASHLSVAETADEFSFLQTFAMLGPTKPVPANQWSEAQPAAEDMALNQIKAQKSAPANLRDSSAARQMWAQSSAATQLWQLLQGLTYAVIIKTLCMAGNVAVQVSPFPTARRWQSKGSTGEVDAAPFLSIAYSGWQWSFYGSFAYFMTARSGFLILVESNVLGGLLGTYYTIVFYKNCEDKGARERLYRYLSCALSLVVFQVAAVSLLPAERSLFVCGFTSSFCSFVGALSTLTVVPTVIKLKESSAISGPLCIATFGSGFVWMACGVMLQDPLIIMPNIVCILATSLCLYLKIVYPAHQGPQGQSEIAPIKPCPESSKYISAGTF